MCACQCSHGVSQHSRAQVTAPTHAQGHSIHKPSITAIPCTVSVRSHAKGDSTHMHSVKTLTNMHSVTELTQKEERKSKCVYAY